MRFNVVICSVFFLSACADVPPNTPGSGVGETYTPVIDLQGADMSRYWADLDGCRAYARQIDAARAEQQGMWAGIIAGALVGAAVGGNQHYAEQGALAGGMSGLASAGVRARTKQEVILANCMAGRGYRVLEGATQAAATNVPSPYVQTPVPSTTAVAAVPPVVPTVPPAVPSASQKPSPVKKLPNGWTCIGCQ